MCRLPYSECALLTDTLYLILYTLLAGARVLYQSAIRLYFMPYIYTLYFIPIGDHGQSRGVGAA